MESLRDEKFVYLTTVGRKTGSPHTVQLWFAFASGRMYLSHEGKYTDWMRNIAHNKRVAVHIGRVSLEADATILNEGEQRELGKNALYEKYYGPAPNTTIDDWFELSTLIELTPVKHRSINLR